MNIELTKTLNLHIYIVSETEKKLCRHNTRD